MVENYYFIFYNFFQIANNAKCKTENLTVNSIHVCRKKWTILGLPKFILLLMEAASNLPSKQKPDHYSLSFFCHL